MVACWIIFAVLLLFISIGFGYFGVLCTKKFNPNEQQKKNMNLSFGAFFKKQVLNLRHIVFAR